MNKYELALVISAKLDDETRAGVVDRAKGYIARFGGELGETEEWGKRKLAYEIQKVTEGYYYFIQFEADSDCPNELEQQMRIMDNVLRYLVVRKGDNDTFSVAPEKKAEEAAEETAKAPAEESAAEETADAPAEEAAAEETADAPAEETVAEETTDAPAEEAAAEETAEAPAEGASEEA